MKLIFAGLMILIRIGVAYSQTDSAVVAYLREHSQAPEEYVMSKATSHRVTILGEGHWLQQDVALVATLIPVLQRAGIDLAVETFRASDQARVDELIAAPEWNERTANEIMRSANWPYQEYRGLLRAAWTANQRAERKLKLLALGPPPNWREVLLPRKISYDEFIYQARASWRRGNKRSAV